MADELACSVQNQVCLKRIFIFASLHMHTVLPWLNYNFASSILHVCCAYVCVCGCVCAYARVCKERDI